MGNWASLVPLLAEQLVSLEHLSSPHRHELRKQRAGFVTGVRGLLQNGGSKGPRLPESPAGSRQGQGPRRGCTDGC